MASNDMGVTVVIVNWNTRDLLARCLESIGRDQGVQIGESTYGERERELLKADVYVVDNASVDGSVTMVREQFPWVQLIANADNVGFAHANNQAISQSEGQYTLLLNSDTEVYPGALGTLVKFMDEHPSAGACGPKLLNSDGSLQVSCHPMLTPKREFWRLIFLDRIWPRATYPQQRWDPSSPHRVEVIKGACLLLRRAALDQVELLDDQYFMYTEEMDLCHRLLQAGWTLWWVPQAAVTHHAEASTRQIAEEMYVQLYHSKIQFHRKFGGQPRADRFKRLLRIAYLPRLAVAALGALFLPSLVARARTYRRLLAELPEM